MYIVSGLLFEQKFAVLLKELQCLVLFHDQKSLLCLHVVAEDGQHLKNGLAAIAIIIDPLQDDSR